MPQFSEERWNYVFWNQKQPAIIDPYDDKNEGAQLLLKRYKEKGLKISDLQKYELEYPWYIYEATNNANPDGEADVYLKALSDWFLR